MKKEIKDKWKGRNRLRGKQDEEHMPTRKKKIEKIA